MHKIEVFGPGCAKCRRLEKNLERAIKEMGIQVEVVKVTDILEIMNRGVMMTPALFINGEAKAVGRVPNVKEIKRMLSEYKAVRY